MLVPKKNRLAVYSYLFKEGVLTCKKDPFLAKHPLIDVPNLHVMKLLQSLKSRGFIHEIFAWRNYYFTLTNEGIEYLREYLHVPADFVPATLKKQVKASAGPSFRKLEGSESRGRGRGRGGDRDDGYRGPKKDGGAPGDFQPEFAGRGRGRGGFRGGRGGAAAGAPASE